MDKSVEKPVMISFIVPKKTKVRMKVAAAATGKTLREIMVQVVDEYLKRVEPALDGQAGDDRQAE